MQTLPALPRRYHRSLATVALTGLLLLPAARAADPEVTLVIRGHKFEPTELKVPANQRIKLIVHNQDTTPEEFESKRMKSEKVVPAGAKVTIWLGPLKPGRYEFVGEYHEASAKGVVIAE
ncbi:MAG: cupredoxin domain-containing protein [Aquincola sp.]|nr:cupredoxin domain-containing protein [Aquincola sp.]MDH4288723.1 cupredoxin domain-containing protein [Aquincola sp.]MDH5329635.1 cupredoxin domain-containing protein [Aquincola sp.]